MPGAFLFIGRPVGWKMEAAAMGTWLLRLGLVLSREFSEIEEIGTAEIVNSRVAMCRNKLVSFARQEGATHLLMVDPDMQPDRWAPQTGKQFFPEAWAWTKTHPGGICAAPYCGPAPDRVIHVFGADRWRRMTRLSRADLRGWVQVAGVGTGLMLLDMAVFEKLEKAGVAPPFFRDQYQDERQEDLFLSQDVEFCLRCSQARIPIWVNFDTPAGHQQFAMEQLPGWENGPPVMRQQYDQLRLTEGGEPVWTYKEPSHAGEDSETEGLRHPDGDDRQRGDDLGHHPGERPGPGLADLPRGVHGGDG